MSFVNAASIVTVWTLFLCSSAMPADKDSDTKAVPTAKNTDSGGSDHSFHAQQPVVKYSFKAAGPRDEALIFTAPGFAHVGEAKIAEGTETGTLRISVCNAANDQPTHCRINVVGPGGHFYEPLEHRFKRYSLTGIWPNTGWGNRRGKAPLRYLGRFFYSDGTAVVQVPVGQVRVEVWKGFEYAPVTRTVQVTAGQTSDVKLNITKTCPMDQHGYWSGDPHIHIPRLDKADDQLILDLMQAEDIHYGAILAYNEPVSRYEGFMKRMVAPQLKGTGKPSTRSHGDYTVQSGQEYRSGSYGHINFYLLDQLVMPGQDYDTNNWPPFGHVSQLVRDAGGVSFYAHGGYAKEIYADVVQGNIDGVELLQFGVYRGIGLTDWYHMLNAGFRVPAMGASDYPACRKLGDCKTYVYSGDDAVEAAPSFEHWMRQMAKGQSFMTDGPLILLTVDGRRPGDQIRVTGDDPVKVTAHVRVRSDVAPVTSLQLIGNGRILHEVSVPKDQGQNRWLDFEIDLAFAESTWIAARAFSFSPLGTPDAEAHTNPVYVYHNDKACYERDSLDVLVKAVDAQIAVHQKRDFPEQARVVAYFQKSRNILTTIRESGGASATGHPSD